MTKIYNADLHCHSYFSDGALAPAELAGLAKQAGVDLWALTDHDQLDGLEEAQQAAQDVDLTFVPGVEVSITWGGRTVHIVGLNIGMDDPTLRLALQSARCARRERGAKMAAYFDSIGVHGTLEGALNLARNPELLSRTHFARYLVATGVCSNMKEAFDRYLSDDGPAYVHYEWPSLSRAIEWIQAAKGIPVIAHPARYGFDTLKENCLFDEFKALGGLAIEVITGSHQPHEYELYAKRCLQFGFAASRGADFHALEDEIHFGHLPNLPKSLTPVWELF